MTARKASFSRFNVEVAPAIGVRFFVQSTQSMERFTT